MTARITTDIFCDFCGNWERGLVSHKAPIQRSRRELRKKGWAYKRAHRGSQQEGALVDVCPACLKKHYPGHYKKGFSPEGSLCVCGAVAVLMKSKGESSYQCNACGMHSDFLASKEEALVQFTKRCYEEAQEKLAQLASKPTGEERGDMSKFKSIVDFIVQDPSKLTERGYPTTVVVVRAFLSRPFNDIANDHSRPEVDQLNDAIVHLAEKGSDECWEQPNDMGHHTEYNCALCGAGLNLSYCNGCKREFRDDKLRSGWYTPLPQKVVELVKLKGYCQEKGS